MNASLRYFNLYNRVMYVRKLLILLFQNTYTNAEKLLAAAQELAQTGECSPNEIYAVARQLEQHVGYAPSSPYFPLY